jgi:phage head maturation protease
MGLLAFDDSESGRMAEGLVSRGTVRGISIGYAVTEWEITDDEGNVVDQSRLRYDEEYIFTAKRFTLLECSLVSVPADSNAFVRSFGSSAPIGATAAAAIVARMSARSRIAARSHANEDISQPPLQRRRRYPGQIWRGGCS